MQYEKKIVAWRSEVFGNLNYEGKMFFVPFYPRSPFIAPPAQRHLAQAPSIGKREVDYYSPSS